MNQNKEVKEPSLYKDFGGFKGFTFQDNINSINKLYYGQGLKISEVPFIFKNENDNKYYISAHKIELLSKDGERVKLIYFPESFLNQVFYHDNLLFFFNSNYTLVIYKIENKSCKRYIFTQKIQDSLKKQEKPKNNLNAKKKKENEEENEENKENEEEKEKEKEKKNDKEKKKENEKEHVLPIEEKKIEEILNLLGKIDQSTGLKSSYEILCNILQKYLSEDLIKNTRQFNGQKKYEIKIDNLHLTCIYEKISEEIDSVGQIRKEIKVNDTQVSLASGIQSLKEYANFKKNKDKNAAEKYINNDFKCPIIFKNFSDTTIPAKKTILCEIKSGFDIKDVLKQLNKRITAISDCLFNGLEKPEYFIGIVNLDSKNAEKLEKCLEKEPIFNDKVMIISIVDSEYCDIDVSFEVNTDFLINNKLDNLEKEMVGMRKEMKDYHKDVIDLIDLLIIQMREYHPNINIPTKLLVNHK